MSDATHAPSAMLDPALQAAMRLSLVPGVGPRTYALLLEALGNPQDVLRAAPSDLRAIPGIGAKLARAIATANQTVEIDDELQRCAAMGIDVLAVHSANYPQRLKEIFDPPGILYCQGQLLPQDDLAIAIVGTRHATSYGLAQAERFSRGLALAGLTIVSGLARGIDAAAHRGALAVGGRTLAVLGSGLLNLYPPDHRPLADEMLTHGALLSEFPTLQPPKAGAFPRRNRLVSGLSLGVIVIEAAERSGALISARHAMEQGREVFAVPGRIDQRNARGCHRLIRDGAKLIESVDDVLAELGPLGTPAAIRSDVTIHHPAELQLNDREQAILQTIERDPTSIDAIVAKAGLPIQQVLAAISALEMRRLVRRVSGNTLIRV